MSFRPVFKVGAHGKWAKMSEPADIMISSDKEIEAQFNFHFSFDNKTTPIFFAMTYPYSYETLQEELHIIEEKAIKTSTIYFKRELLIKSFEGRRVDLLTISSHSKDSGKFEEKVHPALFPAADPSTTLARR